MAKSSYGLALLFAGWGVAAEAEPPGTRLVTADEAMKVYHERFGAAAGRACPDAGRASDEEIVVCGAVPRRIYRLPLPIEREPGETVRHINEPGGGVAAMAGAACSHSCYQPVSVNVFQVIAAAPKVIRHIFHGDD